MNRAKILIADDHRIVAEGLRVLLDSEYQLTEIVEDGRQLIEAALRIQPDVIVADVSMPLLNGLDAIEHLRGYGLNAKVIFLTMHSDALYAVRALRVGASGYLLKHSASSELLTAIEEALAGRTYVAPQIVELLERLPDLTSDSELSLTRRQREILQLVAEGHTARQVAKILHISPRTVEGHRAHIMNLLGARSTADLVQWAIRYGLVKPV
jgi:DNA-binding NarL/FixJ family response regulator